MSLGYLPYRIHNAGGNSFWVYKMNSEENPMFTHNELLAETGKLQKFALRLTKNKADADDLLQSTCLRALEKEHSFEEDTNLFGWTSKIMFNLFATEYRRKMKFESQSDPESILQNQSVPPMQEIGSEVGNIKRAMLKLSPDHQEIVLLICVKGMHYHEVANLLLIPVGTVRSRFSRAKKELQAIMDIKIAPKRFAVKTPVNTNVASIPAFIAAQALKKTIYA
jgi:RNA polymerase sigma-70 factor, ECF subfamily